MRVVASDLLDGKARCFERNQTANTIWRLISAPAILSWNEAIRTGEIFSS
jgi:hypothetical protein